MARAEQKQAFTSSYSAIREHEQEGLHHDREEEEVASPSGCCCCCCFGFGGWKRSNQESKYLLRENSGHEESWFVDKLKNMKEYSEVVAGPKWKNLVRKIGKYVKPKKSTTQSMYTPNSYALNFDDGEEEEEEDDLFVSFSSRFSAPLSSNQQRTSASP
nr:uncharacterized protein LOC113695404 [Coffea arabica]